MSSQNEIERVLCLCARNHLPKEQRLQLATILRTFGGWDDLLYQAEQNGLAPLLHYHLSNLGEVEVPASFTRALRLLYLRHKGVNSVLIRSLKKILSTFEKASIRCLVLKGAALSQLIYSDSGHRPMRDLDLLIHKTDAKSAHTLLMEEGFVESPEELPKDYYHLTPLMKTVDGVTVCVEIHSGIFPQDPPYYHQVDFDGLYRNRQEFDVDGLKASAFANEEMLWHLYQHGFRAPLTYEKPRLIALADIITLVEECIEELDWGRMNREYPSLMNGLSLFHYLSPWSDKVRRRGVIAEPPSLSDRCYYYSGWPAQTDSSNLIGLLRETLCPPHWWTMMYYGCKPNLLSMVYCRLFLHPMHLFRWLKVYGKRWLGELLKGEKKEPCG